MLTKTGSISTETGPVLTFDIQAISIDGQTVDGYWNLHVHVDEIIPLSVCAGTEPGTRL